MDLGNGARLEEVGEHIFAYYQQDGSWGWSNAGLVTDGETSLLVDTLFDLRLTRRMLEAMASVSPAARTIDMVVNTHANGDHCWGNQLVSDAEILGSAAMAAEMADLPPARVRALIRASRVLARLGAPGRALTEALGALGATMLRDLGRAAPWVADLWEPFDFRGIVLTPPARTFEGELVIHVGDLEVRLLEVGPAHTGGDVLVHVPARRVVFTGDILFHRAHPIVWTGPVSRWTQACDRVLAMDVDVIVPGHGPVADKSAVVETKAYLQHLDREARARHAAGMSLAAAIRDIDFSAYRGWIDAERVVANVEAVYRELDGDTSPRDVVSLFARMAEHRRRRSPE